MTQVLKCDNCCRQETITLEQAKAELDVFTEKDRNIYKDDVKAGIVIDYYADFLKEGSIMKRHLVSYHLI